MMNPIQDPRDKTSEIKDQAGDMKDRVKTAVSETANKAENAMREGQSGSDFQTLKSDFQTLREDVMRMMGDVSGKATHKVKEVASDLAHSGQNVLGTAKEKGGELAHTIETQVKDRPLMSVLIAFGAGLLISRMMDRR